MNRICNQSPIFIGKEFLQFDLMDHRGYVRKEKETFMGIICQFFDSVKQSEFKYAFEEVAEEMGYDKIITEYQSSRYGPPLRDQQF